MPDGRIDESASLPLDGTSDDDGDGKTNDEEAALGTDPEVFNLFSETHYDGYPEVTYPDTQTDPYLFYTQTLSNPPAEWVGLPTNSKDPV